MLRTIRDMDPRVVDKAHMTNTYILESINGELNDIEEYLNQNNNEATSNNNQVSDTADLENIDLLLPKPMSPKSMSQKPTSQKSASTFERPTSQKSAPTSKKSTSQKLASTFEEQHHLKNQNQHPKNQPKELCKFHLLKLQ
ncbi:13618_t:CDS:2 [Ambispora gerdemannii]|uniref:13618_t:CDS:1 n=1 Tax=Ambispora gerdemannii TaxID=144530 RepID=A0A9N9CFS7_9GLOM|nr:13618_t:CDS:2 [Ambispora gerdemannii]